MQAKQRKEEKLKKRLQKVLAGEDLMQQRELIQRIAAELRLDLLDCAAALVFMSQPNLYRNNVKPSSAEHFDPYDFEIPLTVPKKKSVRYRLEIGSQHQVDEEEIKDVLVEESGVDRGRIGRIDIRHDHTIVELPDGMPADIFQLLAEVEVRRRKLNIKRLKNQRKFRRYQKPA